MLAPRPHDLLRLSGPRPLPADAPPWVWRALSTVPWVVVRRAAAAPGLIAVGVRGARRSERYAMAVHPGDVVNVVAPEQLATADPRPNRDLPAMRVLRDIRPTLDEARVRVSWGPTGSVGFELATGAATATDASDLDLVLRAPLLTREALDQLAEFHRAFGRLRTRVDCQVETPSGAIALAELAGDNTQVMVRTPAGARLMPRNLAMP
jgi:phosphoribosyl-dephospho-CoA transferase